MSFFFKFFCISFTFAEKFQIKYLTYSAKTTWPYLGCKLTELINLQGKRTARGSSALHLGTSHSALNLFSQISMQEDYNNSELDLAARHPQGTRKLDFTSHDNWRGFHPSFRSLPQSSLCEELTVPGVWNSCQPQFWRSGSYSWKYFLYLLGKETMKFPFPGISGKALASTLFFDNGSIGAPSTELLTGVRIVCIWRRKLKSYLTFQIVLCLIIKMKSPLKWWVTCVPAVFLKGECFILLIRPWGFQIWGVDRVGNSIWYVSMRTAIQMPSIQGHKLILVTYAGNPTK